ncbi:MAG: hypothetical protein NT166_05770 [Candidatus Aminicenantes bacterium]|nr:hypothetical protein [Candidatus Aminicenantes bacterium]
MKLKSLSLILLLLLFPHAGQTGSPDAAVGTWWEVQLFMTVSGSYRYYYNNDTIDGEYSFKIIATASIEQDNSGDYILYPAGEQISVINWRDRTANKEGDFKTTATDLAKTMSPSMQLNYVIKENRKLYFDFEVFLKAPVLDNAHPFKQFLLPRSALNQNIDRKNKYNKNVHKGSNAVQIAEKLFLKQAETVKTFNWQWQREKPDFFNSHSVVLELKIIKRSPSRE